MGTSPSHGRRRWVIGNWKMNGNMVDNEALLSGVLKHLEEAGSTPAAQCGVAVPFPYLFQAAVRLKNRGLDWGAQDVSDQAKGAFTGEVSVEMLRDFEATFSLVGHSERRARHAETDAQVSRKACALLSGGIAPVVCVGESQEVREKGAARETVCGQVRVVAQDAAGLGKLSGLTFAYEPIWAIGTGKSASAEQAQEMHRAIRDTLCDVHAPSADAVRIIYGGSVNAANAKELFSQPDIDGALVGGASLSAHDFVAILSAAGTEKRN